jgi:predicted phosphate transport protein (TIGR00153 family)
MRRESEAVRLSREHVTTILDASLDLDALLAAALAGEKDRISAIFRRLSDRERAADHLERRVVEELSRGELPPKDREDLMRLVTAVDTIADWLKVAGKNVEILVETGIVIPGEVWSLFKEMSKNTVDCCRALKGMTDAFGGSYDTLLARRDEVSRLEKVVDEIYFDTKKILVRTHAHAGLIVLLNDLLEGIENASDFCKHAADTILSLALAGR